MDAVEFLREYARMCAKSSCGDCAIRKANTEAHEVTCAGFLKKYPTTVVAIVEQWAKEHPVKTRQSELLKLCPGADMDKEADCLCINPCSIIREMRGKCIDRACDDCRKEFWSAEVE